MRRDDINLNLQGKAVYTRTHARTRSHTDA